MCEKFFWKNFIAVASTSFTRSDLNIAYLQIAASYFERDEVTEGKWVFLAVCREPHREENGVYEHTARIKGFPSGGTYFGKFYFFDLRGVSTTASQKASAIYSYLRSVNFERDQIPRTLLSSREQADASSEVNVCEIVGNVAAVGAAVVSVALVVVNVASMLRGGPRSELVERGGHITVGGGHNQLGSAISMLTSNVASFISGTPSGAHINVGEGHFSPATLQDLIPQHPSRTFSSMQAGSSVPSARDNVTLVSDRPDPMDANSERYGYNGTIEYDNFQRMNQDLQSFSEQIESLRGQLDSTKLDSIRSQIRNLQERRTQLNVQSLKALGLAVLEAMGAGAAIEIPALAVGNALLAVEKFKEFGELGYQAGEVGTQIDRLLELERSLERANELQRLSDLRG